MAAETLPIVETPPPTPTEGGSYLVDEATGELTLIERTQPQEPQA